MSGDVRIEVVEEERSVGSSCPLYIEVHGTGESGRIFLTPLAIRELAASLDDWIKRQSPLPFR